MKLTNKSLLKPASFLLIALILVVGSLIVFNLQRTSILNELANLYLIPRPEKLTELYFDNSENLPGSATSNQVHGMYAGTIFNVSSNVSASLTLTEVQQSQGKIFGYLTIGSGRQGSAPFSGTIDEAKHLRLTVTDASGHAKFFFEGIVQSAASMSGNYYQCGTISTLYGQCSQASGSYGIWSLAPVFSFAFVIHNLETTNFLYAYEVSINLNGTQVIVDSGKVLVKNNQYYVKNEQFTPMNSPGCQEVVVDLSNLHQSIDFWMGR